MIVDNGKYYLYRHIRLDKNEPFYIGVGTKRSGNTFIQKYIRAYCKHDKRKIWKGIVSRTEYVVEIIMESNSRDFLLEKEKEFIGLYGRIDIKTGTLSNLTDGGEGTMNKSREQLDKELITRKNNGSYQRNKERWIKYINENIKGKDSVLNKKSYLYNKQGVFVSQFKNMTDCSVYVGLTRSLVCKLCRDKVSHSKYIFSDTFFGQHMDISIAKKQKYNLKRRLVKMSRNWEMLELYKTATEAGNTNGFDRTNIKFIVDRKIKYRQHNWRWIN